MAENTFRALRNRDSRGDAATNSRDAGGDPLAELARLIGQSDPNGEVGRHGRVDSFNDRESGGGLEWAAHDTYAEQGHDQKDHDQSGFAEPSRSDDRYALPPLAASYPPYSSNTAYSEPEADYSQPMQGAGQLAVQAHPLGEQHEDPRYPDEREPLPPGRQGSALAPASQDDRYPSDDQQYDDADDQSYPPEDYDDQAPRRRRSGAVVVVAVLGLAVLGSAGAFAYRSMFGGSMLPTLPPIIKASNGPNKIVPNNSNSKAGVDSQANAKTPGAGEKLVSREEQPVDIDDPSKSPPRVVSTIPVVPPQDSAAPGVAPPMPATNAAPPASAPAAGAPEPKKIHTVIIRSDQSGGAEAGAGAAPAPRSSGSRFASRPVAAAPRAGQNAPLALVPQSDEAPTASTPRTRTALARPTSLGSSAAPAAEGGYSVQVSSQRSEAGAKAAFRALQVKYPGQLGGRQATVRRADLGAKGVYYRALVGPYASMEQAAGVCSGMKAAGGKCVVQKN